MQFREQVEQMLQCKVNGMCARDALVTQYLKERGDYDKDLLEAKRMDDELVVMLVMLLSAQ